MNDLEYRRRIYINPRDKSEEILAKQGQDEDANQFAIEMNELEDMLEEVMDIKIPERLVDQILTQSVDKRAHHKSWLGTRYTAAAALAASVLLFSSVIFTNWFQADNDLHSLVMQHVYEELDYLNFDQPFPAETAHTMINLVGGKISSPLDNLRYAVLCQIQDTTSVHLLIKGRHGIITVLLMPNNQLDQSLSIDDPRFHGLIVTNGAGSIAIIGDKGEPILDVLNSLTKSLAWQT